MGEVNSALVSPDTFGVLYAIPVNPGIYNLCPWLSTFATRFEKYRFLSLKFRYETESPTTQPGSVMLSTDYDSMDNPPGTKVEFMSMKSAVRTAAWNPIVWSADSDDLSQQNEYFCRYDEVPEGADKRLYDTGVFYLGVSNTGESANLGELYIEYTIEFYAPQLPEYLSLTDDIFVFGSGHLSPTLPNHWSLGPLSKVGGSFTPPLVNLQQGAESGDLSSLFFTRPWVGFLEVYCLGTGIINGALDVGSTGVLDTRVISSTSNQVRFSYYIEAMPGDFITPFIQCTAMTVFNLQLVPSNLPLLSVTVPPLLKPKRGYPYKKSRFVRKVHHIVVDDGPPPIHMDPDLVSLPCLQSKREALSDVTYNLLRERGLTAPVMLPDFLKSVEIPQASTISDYVRIAETLVKFLEFL